MSLRSKTREDSHFLVKFVTDSSLLVRSRSLIKTEQRIVVGNIYPVQWGSASDVDDALILSSGDYIQLRRELDQYEDGPSSEQDDTPSSPESPVSPAAIDDERSPPQKRARVIRRSRDPIQQAKVSKPLASVITRAPAPAEEDDVFTFRDEDESSSVAVARALFNSTSTPLDSAPMTTLTPRSAESSTPTRPTSPVRGHTPRAAATPEPGPSTSTASPMHLPISTPTVTHTARPLTPVSPLVLDRTDATLLSLVKSVLAKNNVMAKMLSESNQLLKKLDAKVSSQAIQIQILQEQVQHLTTLNHPTSVPPSTLVNPGSIADNSDDSPYNIPSSTLLEIKRNSLNPGNFAVKIVERLFPELFGEENLRFNFSYNGGGVKGKKSLDGVRKGYIRKYVCQHYPEVKETQAWKMMVVGHINERLRRPVEKKKDRLRRISRAASDSVFFDPPETSYYVL